MPQVSVIVTTYNSDLSKLTDTLDSIVIQEDIDFEVVVSDDGSQNDYQQELTEYFDTHQFSNYSFAEKTENRGTVRNCLKGLKAAVGEYVYSISPGDKLFEKNILSKLYKFSIKTNADIVFGDVLNYWDEKGQEIREKGASPKHAQLFDYNPNHTEVSESAKIMFLYGDYICGASYFRKKECAEIFIKEASQVAKYAEDTPSTLMALMAGARIYHYPETVVLYEYGSGISTNGDSKWTDIVMEEYRRTYDLLKENQYQS